MRDRLLEGRLVATIVGGVLRIFEALGRMMQMLAKAVRLPAEAVLSAKVDSRLARGAKRRLARKAVVDDASVVLVTEQGEYTGDPKYIAQEMLRRGLHCTITWAMRDGSAGPYPGEFQFVQQGTARFFRTVAQAKLVVQQGDCLQRADLQQSKGQHWVDSEQLNLGRPRNDILVGTSQGTVEELRKKVLDRLDIADTGQKFLLYAPKHDGPGRAALLSGVDIAGLRAQLARVFGGSWEILIRTEYADRRRSAARLAGLPRYCRNASTYPDMQELLAVADAGLTDYSSWIWDYALTRKPSFLFSVSPGAYTQQTGAIRDLVSAPFAVATSSRQLLDNIEQFDQAIYSREIAEMLERCGSADDGNAAARVVDEIERLLAS